jgi:hypothetical protein
MQLSFYLFLCLFIFPTKPQQKEIELTVLQFNIWQEGTVVAGGFDAVIDEIIRLNADLIALSEVRNYNGKSLDKRLVGALKEKGFEFYAQRSEDTGILSRFPILSQTAIYPLKNDQGSITKAVINVMGQEVAFYSAHLDYRNCSLYLPRGYDGSSWEKLPRVVTDTTLIAKDNLQSKRDEAISAFISDAKNEIKKNRLVILGGDFNEPSHLDWTAATANLYDHNGVVMLWHNTLRLSKNGFRDVYREIYPNTLTHPGFTFPADNPLVDIKKLAWSPDADDRDRIDYIFYYPSEELVLLNTKLVGPRGSIVRNQRKLETSEDIILEPMGIWPTDHKALLANFKIYLK